MCCSENLIDILLPTYNGERFLRELMDSLLAQKDVATRIIVRDDASSDTTLETVWSYARHASIVIHSGSQIGVVGNVDRLLALSEQEGKAHYFALCDQDDVWYPYKLDISMQAMRLLESRHGKEVPLLVCSDARCVDARGHPLHPSFLHRLGLSADWGDDLRKVLVMSHVLGCSCLGNTALRRQALPIPSGEDIFMHDWWLLLVATCFGAVQCIGQALLDYRQHSANTLGVRGQGTLLQRLMLGRENTGRSQRQARTFLERYAHRLNISQSRTVYAWAHMPERPWWLRRWLCWRHGFAKPGLARLLT